MKQFFLLFLISTFSMLAYGQDVNPFFARATQVNPTKKLVAFVLTEKNRDKLAEGDALFIRNKSEVECELKVTKFSSKYAFARFVDCDQMKEFQKGNKLYLFDKEFEVTEKGKKNPWEFWYLYWGLGWANFQYSADIQNNIDIFSKTPSTSHFPFYFELASPYFSLFQKPLLLGWILHVGWDQFRVGGTDTIPKSDIRGIHQMTGPSAFYFFGQAPGQGPFVRLDMGLAWMDVKIESTTGQTLFSADKNGYGVTGGGGYSHPITNETRLLYQVLYSYRKFKSDDLSILTFGLGWLF